MCGIVGAISSAPVNETRFLSAACVALTHRGPDAGGGWWSEDGRVGLAHRRLSIIDLSPLGSQPMRSRDGQAVIVFNGEIYNFQDLRAELRALGHSFRSTSDTEVVLAAYRQWGLECPKRFIGAFAFAIYDARERRTFLCRDRAGEKPLFYTETGGRFRFASELKALMADPDLPRKVDRAALDCCLGFGFVPGELCILQGVRKLPPGHAMTYGVDDGRMKTWRYWTLPEAPAEGGAGADELLSELEPLLEDSVRRQLVSDVPIGILLSGGVDSSLIAAMAARRAPKVRTFTVTFPGHREFDESEHAELIARHFGTEHHRLEAGEVSVDLMPLLARQFDEPVVDSSMVPTYLVTQLVRRHCTVALGGDGGDELFGGYAHYSRLLWMRERLGRVPLAVRSGIAGVAEAVLPVGFKGRNWAQSLASDLDRGLPLIASYFDRRSRRRLLTEEWRAPGVAEDIRDGRIPSSGDLLWRATRMDFENYLPEDILVKVDRASMLNSLEVRAPFLDHRLIEFAFGKVPSDLKATQAGRKILLKKLCARVLPPQFDLARKQGFSIPLAKWLSSGPWRERFAEILLDSSDGPFRKDFVRSLLDGQSKGRSNSERLFALTLFELWRREYRVSAGS